MAPIILLLTTYFLLPKKWSHFFDGRKNLVAKKLFVALTWSQEIFRRTKLVACDHFFRFATKKKTYGAIGQIRGSAGHVPTYVQWTCVGQKNVPHRACLNTNLFPSMFTDKKHFCFQKKLPPFFVSSGNRPFFSTESRVTPQTLGFNLRVPRIIKVREF